MSSDLERAHRSLDSLPESPKRAQALRLLAEIEEAGRRRAESLRKLELALDKLAPSPIEQRLYKLLPWVVALLALAALYTGISAIWNAEYCFYLHHTISCNHGLSAQLHGGATVAVAALLAIIPLPACKAKVVALWFFGLSTAAILLSPILLYFVA